MTTSTPKAPRASNNVQAKENTLPRQVQSELSADDQLRLFQTLDVLQKERAAIEQRTESVMDAATREDQIVDRLRQLRQAQGLPVVEEELRAAVRATREPTNLAYAPAPQGIARNLANIYLARARWLPAVVFTLVLAVASGAGFMVVSYTLERSFQSTVAASQQALQGLQGERSKLARLAAGWPQGLGQEVLRTRFDRTLQEIDQDLATMASVVSAPSRETIDQVEPLVEKAQASVSKAAAIENDSRVLLSLSRGVERNSYRVADPSWPEVEQRARVRHAALVGALTRGDVPAARAEVKAIQALGQASVRRSALREAASLVPVAGQAEAQALRARGEAALLAADLSAADAAMTSLRTLTDTLAVSYTMKIVNEEGVKSGVWRHPNDNPSARNYYVVVDALDSSGNPVRVKVVNEETGKTEETSRFAVRVSEAEYEKVKADKMDNGLIENALVGTKSAGKLAPDFNVDTAGGGIITHW